MANGQITPGLTATELFPKLLFDLHFHHQSTLYAESFLFVNLA
jgi:hypothetical protein